MKLGAKLKAYARVMKRAKRPMDNYRLLRKRPALFVAVNMFETALLVSSRVDARLKSLAQIKTSALIGCPF